MTPPIRQSEPDELIQGDSWQWHLQSDLYPATDGWTLTYDVSGAGRLSFSATTNADGISYDVLVPFATTQSLPAGTYLWHAYVSATAGANAGQKQTIRSGVVRIVANYATASPLAQQQHAERMVTVLEAEIEARVTGTGSAMQAYAIEGRSISKIALAELYTLRAKYLGEIIRFSRGGRLPPLAIVFGGRPAGGPGGAGNRSGGNGGFRGVE